MSEDLANPVHDLEKSLVGVKLSVAFANNETFKIQQDMRIQENMKIRESKQENYRIAHIDWFYHFFEHDEKLSLQDKRQLASAIVFVLFNEVGEDLLTINPEEFNMVDTRSGLCVTRRNGVMIRGHKMNDRVFGLKRKLEHMAEKIVGGMR